jgi:hypothetical protein
VLLATTATPVAAAVDPVVDDAGPVEVIVTGGSLNVGETFDLPSCPGGVPANPGDECITFNSVLHPNGVWVVPVDGIEFPPLSLEPFPGLVVNVNIAPSAAGVGRLEPSTGLARMRLGIKIELSAPGIACSVGPLVIDLTSGASGNLTGTPYNPTSGETTLVNKTFTVPAVTACGILNNIINGLLNLPLAAGSSSATFSLLLNPVVVGSGSLVTSLPAHGFNDVPSNGNENDLAARWLKFNNVTTGFGGSSTVFNPNGQVTRGQMALFLYRLMDSPSGFPAHGFNDVPNNGNELDRAVRWLKAKGITTGFGGSATVFNPSGVVTRGQMALFLYRVAGKPTGAPPHGFTDMPTNGNESDLAARWLKANGITTGFGGSATIFNSAGPCTRIQMGLFLNRLASTYAAWGTTTPPSTITFG